MMFLLRHSYPGNSRGKSAGSICRPRCGCNTSSAWGCHRQARVTGEGHVPGSQTLEPRVTLQVELLLECPAYKTTGWPEVKSGRASNTPILTLHGLPRPMPTAAGHRSMGLPLLPATRRWPEAPLESWSRGGYTGQLLLPVVHALDNCPSPANNLSSRSWARGCPALHRIPTGTDPAGLV